MDTQKAKGWQGQRLGDVSHWPPLAPPEAGESLLPFFPEGMHPVTSWVRTPGLQDCEGINLWSCVTVAKAHRLLLVFHFFLRWLMGLCACVCVCGHASVSQGLVCPFLPLPSVATSPHDCLAPPTSCLPHPLWTGQLPDLSTRKAAVGGEGGLRGQAAVTIVPPLDNRPPKRCPPFCTSHFVQQ